jgi:hypothetical protein
MQCEWFARAAWGPNPSNGPKINTCKFYKFGDGHVAITSRALRHGGRAEEELISYYRQQARIEIAAPTFAAAVTTRWRDFTRAVSLVAYKLHSNTIKLGELQTKGSVDDCEHP